MSLMEACADMYDIGLKNDKLQVLYKANNDVALSVKTTSGLTEEITMKHIVMQGDTWASTMASVQGDSFGQELLDDKELLEDVVLDWRPGEGQDVRPRNPHVLCKRVSKAFAMTEVTNFTCHPAQTSLGHGGRSEQVLWEECCRHEIPGWSPVRPEHPSGDWIHHLIILIMLLIYLHYYICFAY
jgi:hypothetical protein